MSQTDTAPDPATKGLVLNWTRTASFLDALKTSYSGATLPTDPSVGQKAHRTSDSTDWVCVAVGPAVWRPLRIVTERVYDGPLSGSLTRFLSPAGDGKQLVAIEVVSDTATTGSAAGVKGYLVQVANLTQASTLFGSAPGTKDGEWVANTPATYAPTQNQSAASGDQCQLQITQDGSGDALANVAIFATWIMEG